MKAYQLLQIITLRFSPWEDRDGGRDEPSETVLHLCVPLALTAASRALLALFVQLLFPIVTAACIQPYCPGCSNC